VTVEKLERWFNLLPRADRDLPFIVVEGKILTPREMLEEARGGTSLGLLAQRMWETRSTVYEEKLVKERVKKWLARYPSDKPLYYTIGIKRQLTPRQIMQEVEKQTPIGKQIKEVEASYLKYLEELKKRA